MANDTVASNDYPPLSNRRIIVHPYNPEGVPYHMSVEGSYPDSRCSVDMVRLTLRMRGGAGSLAEDFARRHQWLHLLPTAPSPDGDERIRFWPCSSNRPGNWDTQYTYTMGDSSVTLGWGLWGADGCDMEQAYVEFNPNKVAHVAEFVSWVRLLSDEVRSAGLKRWDLAYDVPICRDCVRLGKDRRAYGAYFAKTYTEYLGQRSHVGYVKVYDKASELGLDGVSLTRVEMTCDGRWSVDDIESHWPDVYQIAAVEDSGLTATMRVMAGLLADRARAGASIEPELHELNFRTRKKLLAAIADINGFEFPREAAESCLVAANSWADTFGGR